MERPAFTEPISSTSSSVSISSTAATTLELVLAFLRDSLSFADAAADDTAFLLCPPTLPIPPASTAFSECLGDGRKTREVVVMVV